MSVGGVMAGREAALGQRAREETGGGVGKEE